MSGKEEEIDVRIGAKTEGLTDGLAKATSGVKSAVSQIEGHFSGLGGMARNIAAPFLALGGVLAGGAIFKDVIKETLAWTGQAVVLSRQLGITTEQASVLNLALGDLRIETETYLKAAQMMTRQVASGGEGFQKLGIQVKDAKGHYKSTSDLMAEVMTKLNGLKGGTDRNVAGMAIFGRAWGEASRILRLNSEALEEARQKAEKLGLLVGGDAVEASKRYKMALNDVDDVLLALKVRIGKEVIPVITEMAEEMEKTGPGAVDTLGYFIKAITTAFMTFGSVVKMVTYEGGYALFGLAAIGNASSKALAAAIKGNLSGAKEAYKQGMADLLSEMKLRDESITKEYQSLGMRLNFLWDPSLTKPSKAKDGGDDKKRLNDKGPDTSDKVMQALKLELEEKKALESNWFTWSAARELAFWQEKLSHLGKGTKAYVSVLGEVNKLRKTKQQEEHEAELEGLRAQMDAVQGDGQARLALQQEITTREVMLHGGKSKEVLASLREEARQRREIAEETHRIEMTLIQRRSEHALALLGMDAAALEARVATGDVSSEQRLQQERAFADRRLQIQLKALNDELLLGNLSTEQKTQIDAKRAALYDEHIREMQGIGLRLEQLQQAQMQAFWSPLTEAWNQALAGMLAGTMTFSQGMKGIWKGLGKMLDQAVMDMVNSWIAAEVKKFAMSIALKVKELVTHQAVAKAKQATDIQTATTSANASAVAGGAKAAESAAQIPFIGWIIAIGAGLAVLAGIKSMMGGMSSAEGGWGQIPSDQLAMVHKNEMVLPAREAGTVRALGQWMESGGVPSGGGGGNLVVNINAIDRKGVADFFREHGSTLAEALRGQGRNFAFVR